MTNASDDAKKPNEPRTDVSSGSDLNPAVVQPGSKADPSRDAEWGEHVKGYFNREVIPGEALPKASEEAKE
jgi:hypothetical protein